MNKLTNPFIWLRRFRKRCGYGIHSPFAFNFVRNIVYEQTPYYAYASLDKDLAIPDRFRIRKHLHLIFRIANWRQPHHSLIVHGNQAIPRYLNEACKTGTLATAPDQQPIDLCILDCPNDEAVSLLTEHSILILDHLPLHRQWFQNLPSVVTFDLYDIGIAFFNPKYNKQNYIVNF